MRYRRTGASRSGEPEQHRCFGHPDPEIFFSDHSADQDLARAFCEPCPVRLTCLAGAHANREWGIWGGVLLEAGKPVSSQGRGRPSKERLARQAAVEAEQRVLLEQAARATEAALLA